MGVRRFLLSVVVALSALAAAASAQSTAPPASEGEWVNVDPNTRGISRITISSGSNGPGIRAFGRCHPRDCDWGIQTLEAVGRSVEDRDPTEGFAVWDHGFATAYMTLALHGDEMAVETVRIYKDHSGRTNTRTTETFIRAK